MLTAMSDFEVSVFEDVLLDVLHNSEKYKDATNNQELFAAYWKDMLD